MHEAACVGDQQELERLLATMPHFMNQSLSADPFGRCLLHVCAVNGHTDCVKWLLARPNIKV